jgi:hypothetical protein
MFSDFGVNFYGLGTFLFKIYIIASDGLIRNLKIAGVEYINRTVLCKFFLEKFSEKYCDMGNR